MAARFGDVPLAAHQVTATIWSTLTFALDALAIAAQALTGRALGAGDVRATRAATGLMVRWGVWGGVVLGAAVLALAPVLPAMFTPDPAVRSAIAAALGWAADAVVVDDLDALSRAGERLGMPATAAYVELEQPLFADVMAATDAPTVVVPLLLSAEFSVGLGTAIMHLVIGLPIASIVAGDDYVVLVADVYGKGVRPASFDRLPREVGARSLDRAQLARDDVAVLLGRQHHGLAEERGHEVRARLLVDLVGRSDLLDDPLVHHHDEVGERYRLGLGMGDVDERDAEIRLKPLELAAHPEAQELVEGGPQPRCRGGVSVDHPAHHGVQQEVDQPGSFADSRGLARRRCHGGRERRARGHPARGRAGA